MRCSAWDDDADALLHPDDWERAIKQLWAADDDHGLPLRKVNDLFYVKRTPLHLADGSAVFLRSWDRSPERSGMVQLLVGKQETRPEDLPGHGLDLMRGSKGGDMDWERSGDILPEHAFGSAPMIRVPPREVAHKMLREEYGSPDARGRWNYLHPKLSGSRRCRADGSHCERWPKSTE